MIDNRLNWSHHIAFIKGKISKGIGIISKVKYLLNRETLKSLYYSFVYPYLQYCIEVWGKASGVYMNSVIKLQKKSY